MALYLGFDTSNYTTSAAVYDSDARRVIHRKQLLCVRSGALGLKQSDAVFAHVKQLPQILEGLFFAVRQELSAPIAAVGASVRPRSQEGSYMPCFLVGELAARSVAATQGVPFYPLSHQNGHNAAALYSAGRLDLIGQEFIAFHLSGGTTECVHVTPDEQEVFSAQVLSQSMDLKCGQAIDRVGAMLGLSFPAGKELDALSLKSEKKFSIRTTFRDGNCCISGLENQCARMVREGALPEDVARYCIEYVCAVVRQMALDAREALPGRPLIFSGGVMSNSLIRQRLTEELGGFFAQPEFSADNAAGIAVLTAQRSGCRV